MLFECLKVAKKKNNKKFDETRDFSSQNAFSITNIDTLNWNLLNNNFCKPINKRFRIEC